MERTERVSVVGVGEGRDGGTVLFVFVLEGGAPVVGTGERS